MFSPYWQLTWWLCDLDLLTSGSVRADHMPCTVCLPSSALIASWGPTHRHHWSLYSQFIRRQHGLITVCVVCNRARWSDHQHGGQWLLITVALCVCVCVCVCDRARWSGRRLVRSAWRTVCGLVSLSHRDKVLRLLRTGLTATPSPTSPSESTQPQTLDDVVLCSVFPECFHFHSVIWCC